MKLTLHQIITQLNQRGLRLSVEDGKLYCRGAKGALDDDLKALLAEHKAGLIELLSAFKTDDALTPIPKAQRGQPLPLSFTQERLWFLEQYEADASTYYLPGLLHLKGTLDHDALENSLRSIVERHEVLRTHFISEHGTPQQIVGNAEAFQVQWHQVILAAEETLEAFLEKTIQTELAKPFQLETDCLLRVHLYQVTEDEHYLFLNMHHIVSDGWSIGILIQELAILYKAALAQETNPLPPLEIHYGDYAVWQKEGSFGEILEEQLAYWVEMLKNTPTLALPTTYPRPAQQSLRGDSVSFTINSELTQAFEQLTQRQDTTLFMGLVSVLSVLLHRYCQQDDIAIGTPIANRNRPEWEPLIGCFANTIVLRQDLSDNPNFITLLQRVKQRTLGAYEHQDVPFEKIVNALGVARETAYPPLFQVLFVLQNAPTVDLELPNLSIEVKPFKNPIANFDITLELSQEAGGLSGNLQYCCGLFSRDFVEAMAVHFQQLVCSIVANPHYRLDALEILTHEEKMQLLVVYNQHSPKLPQEGLFAETCLPTTTVHHFLEAQAVKAPEQPAVLFEGQELTYQVLNERANQLAHYLKSQGVETETLVAICMERSLDMMVGLLGILKSGGAYVPIDPHHPQDRIAYMLEDSQATILLTQTALEKRFEDFEVKTIALDQADRLWEEQPNHNPMVNVKPEHLAYVIYTSGSTGKPKGVMVEHRNVVNFLGSMKQAPGMAAHDHLLAVTPISFDIHVLELYLPLVVGARVTLASTAMSQTPQTLAQALAKAGITLMQATPATWHVLLEDGWQPTRPLKILCGGEALPETLKTRLLAHSEIDLWNMYGPTETTVWSSTTRLTQQAPIHLGQPIANTQFYVLDPHLNPVPKGIPGELYIGGAGLARGYFRRSELTEIQFIRNSIAPEQNDRLYKTGDLVRYQDDGRLEYLGRCDQQIKLHGFRIEPGEIEYHLSSMATVENSVVLAKENPQGEKVLVAYLVCNTSPELSEIKSALRAKLPDYMIPSALMVLDALPLTPNGKVDKRALAKMDVAFQASRDYVAPRDEKEQLLALLFARALQLPDASETAASAIGIHDNFFERGGHSLLATQVVSQIRQHFSQDIPLKTFFEKATVTGLSEVLKTQERSISVTPIVPTNRNEPMPLSFAQERLWFLEQYESQGTAYHMPGLLHLRGTLDTYALEQSLQTIVARHESLRTHFINRKGVAYQQVATVSDLVLQQHNLGHYEGAEQREVLDKAIQTEVEMPFHLESDLLFRACLYRISPDEHYLLVNMHHIVSDAWSVGVIVKEFVALYEAYTQGQSSPLASLPIHYGDYAVWQRNTLSEEVIGEELEFWKKALYGVPVLELPTSYPRPAQRSYRGDRVTFMVDMELTQALEALSQQQGVTLFMCLLSAFGVLLKRYSQQEASRLGVQSLTGTHQNWKGWWEFFSIHW